MNLERDKFLTEAMGEHWHEHTMTCGYTMTRLGEYISDIKTTSYTNDFSTWSGFGKLWEWAQKQEWLCDFEERVTCFDYSPLFNIIHPDRFADAVCSYLKEKAK